MGVAGRRTGRRRFRLSAAAGGAALTAAVYSLRNVVKTYRAGDSEFRLSVPQLDIAGGAKLAFVGESGSGKSTLLELLAMILRPDESEQFDIRLPDGGAEDLAALWKADDADRLSDLRSRHIGYVLQYGGLLPYLSVRDNIELSRRLLELDVEEHAADWADRLNIGGQLDKLPGELSVGQRQRVAIARALVHEPAIVIADEPTASVDPPSAKRIMQLMVSLVDELGVTLIVASHALRLMREVGLDMIDHRMDAAKANVMHVTVSNAAH